MNALSSSHWLAAFTEPRLELPVRDALAEIPVDEVFVPVFHPGGRRSGPRSLPERLLFTRYVFFRISLSDPRSADETLDSIRKTEGIQKLVGPRGRRPSVIEEGEINVLKALTSGVAYPTLVPLPQRGRKARIRRGAFEGATGIVLRSNARITVLAFTLPVFAGAYELAVPTPDLALLDASPRDPSHKPRHRGGRRMRRTHRRSPNDPAQESSPSPKT